MSFLNPWFLGFFSLLVPVFALYFLKSKPKRQSVPSNLIWKLVLERVKPNSFLQRFQNSLFLLLQALTITLVVLAMARPTGLFSEGLKRVIILDVSASMSSTDLSPSRFFQAKERARHLCRDSHRRLAVYSLSDRLKPAISLMDDPGLALTALERLKVTQAATPDRETVFRLLRDLERLEADEIFLLSDTLDLDIPPDFMPRTALKVEIFGLESGNVGIANGQAVWDRQNQVMWSSVDVKNTSGTLINATLHVEEKSLDRFPVRVTLNPYENVSLKLPAIPLPKATITLTAPDQANRCPADDRWFFCEPNLRPIILVAAPKNSVLFRLTSALPALDIRPYSEDGVEAAAAVLSTQDVVGAMRRPSCLFGGFKTPVGPGEILPYETDHPLTRFTDWDAIPVDCLRPLEERGNALVECIQGTLLSEENTIHENRRLTRIWAGIDPEATRGSIFLPILLYNVIEYLLRDSFPRLSYPVGHSGLSLLWYGNPPETSGFHQVPDRDNLEVAVNLQSPAEVQIAPGHTREPTTAQKLGRSVKEQAESPWPALLSFSFMFLLFEWYFFLRRS
jgi:hypothetical protein